MATVDQSRCPVCGAGPGTLALSRVMIAKPLGSHSLSGSQMKVSAIDAPVLTCAKCDLRLVGEFDVDGRHVTFRRPRP